MDGATCFRNLNTREKRRVNPPATRSLQSDEQVYGGRTQCGGGDHQSRETNGERARLTTTWLDIVFETIFQVSFCHIKCRDIVAHLFCIRASRAELPNLSHKMARVHQVELFRINAVVSVILQKKCD